MRMSSKTTLFLAAMAAVGGSYFYGDRVEQVKDQLVGDLIEHVSTIPSSFRSLPDEVRAAGAELRSVALAASSNVAVGLHDLQAKW